MISDLNIVIIEVYRIFWAPWKNFRFFGVPTGVLLGGWAVNAFYQIQALARALASQLKTHRMAQRRERLSACSSHALTKDCDDADTQCSNKITRWSAVFKLPRIWPFVDMDGLSAAVSIIALVQRTGEVIGYLNDVKEAPRLSRSQPCLEPASGEVLFSQASASVVVPFV